MRIIFECRALNVYPLGRGGFRGGTELYVERLAHGLAERGHVVHVVTPDLTADEQRGPTEFWWPPTAFPTQADVVVAVPDLRYIEPYAASTLVVASNGGVDPDDEGLGDDLEPIDAIACFSQTHIDLLRAKHPALPAEKCWLTGLGVDLADYPWPLPVDPTHPQIRAEQQQGTRRVGCKVFGQLLWSNDPMRGLWHLLDIYDHVRARVPEVSLHVAYDFERQFQVRKWMQWQQAELLWECRERLAVTPGVVNLGALTRPEVIAETSAAYLHVMPSDPPNVGSQIHGLLQLECAAAGTPLVLSDTEAFPELFAGCAEILPLPGKFFADPGRRVTAEDWADIVVEILQDKERWARMAAAGREVAARHTWDAVVARWDAMLSRLAAGAREAVPV